MMILKAITAAAVLAIACGSGQAAAADIVAPCNKLTDLSVVATECAGWYAGNLLNNGQNGDHVAAQVAALQTIGLTWDGNWDAVDLTKVGATGSNKDLFNFTGVLNGDVWIGIHKGKGGTNGYESTGFFRLTVSDLDAVSLNLKGASSAVVYAQRSAVPEPGTWAMLLVGFAAIGAGLRRRKAVDPTLLTAA